MGGGATVRRAGRWRRSAIYLICAAAVVPLGLASRRFGEHLPPFVADYAGDTLWALLVFLGISALATGARLLHRSGAALFVSFAVEFSQLYHAPWINGIRDTTLGGLVLGFGFLWSDLVCYAVGIALGGLADRGVCAYGRESVEANDGSPRAG